MMKSMSRGLMTLCALAPFTLVNAAPQGELTTNGDFETGDETGWQYVPSGNSNFNATSFQPNNGVYSGELFNALPASLTSIEQSNLGTGAVQPGDTIAISFSIRLQGNEGSAFAELISETSGGPPSAVEILGGGPLPIPFFTSVWQNFSYVTTAGPDVSAGISLRVTAQTGFDANSFVTIYVDDVSVEVLPGPPPGAAYCLGDGSGAACPCNNDGQLGSGCENSAQSGATLTGFGSASLSNDTFAMNVFSTPWSVPGLIIRGNSQVAIPAGDGLLCTAGAGQRSQVQVTVFGSTTFTDFNGSPFGSVANVGAPTNFQFWYRDPQGSPCGGGFNFTNAWTVTYQP